MKFVLRFLSAFRRPDLVGSVLENLQKSLPLADGVATYFDVLDDIEDAGHAQIDAGLLAYVTGERFFPDFATPWLLDPFTRSTSWNNLPEWRKTARDSTNRFIRRHAMLGLRQNGSRSAVLDAKSARDARMENEGSRNENE